MTSLEPIEDALLLVRAQARQLRTAADDLDERVNDSEAGKLFSEQLERLRRCLDDTQEAIEAFENSLSASDVQHHPFRR